MQLSAYVGNRLRGPSGAAAAGVGFVLPAFLLMTILSAAYFSFGNLPAVRALFTGLAAIVVAIMLNACIFVSQIALYGW